MCIRDRSKTTKKQMFQVSHVYFNEVYASSILIFYMFIYVHKYKSTRYILHLKHLGSVFMFIFPPPICHFHPVPDVFPRIHCWSYIKNYKIIIFVDYSAIIIVNNVSYIFTTSVYNPIMSIEW